MSKKPTVSLIIPVYNKARFVCRCLESVARQTNQWAQVIIIDDGSTDGSSELIDEFADKYCWEVFHSEKNMGVSNARNLGLEMARGDYIAFLDADDALTDDAIEVMTAISRHEFNICQFGQYRYHVAGVLKDPIRKGHYQIEKLPRRWAMVWNKLYKKSFIDKNEIRFRPNMQFGEDELFNAECLLANGELYQAPQTLCKHFFDDKRSLCRGELSLERLERLLDALESLKKKYKLPKQVAWLDSKIQTHKRSALFARFGYKEPGRQPTGKYDIVYFVKDALVNEELRYSLRSVEKNWQYNQVWFYGGCPNGLKPDKYVRAPQLGFSKWEKVRSMLLAACKNDDITENFWLFNDDFFVLRPIGENMPPQYNGELMPYIERTERRNGGQTNDWSRRLRHLVQTLEGAGKGTLNYAVHKPMLINRQKMLEVLKKFPDEPMSRALYGNYWEIGGVSKHDMKIKVTQYQKLDVAIRTWEFISTSDESFREGNVGEFLRNEFNEKSRFEE